MSKEINRDLGILLLRIAVGGLMVFHGVHKLIHGHEAIRGLLAKNNLPDFLWLGVPVGEIAAPICILLGVFTRISSLIVAFTMVMSIYMTSQMGAFSLGKTGGLVSELNLFYLLASLSIFFLGAGKYNISKKL